MRYILVFCLITIIVVSSASCFAAGDDNELAAVALYIDTSGHYVPGVDFIDKALNEVIRFKINALFLGSEVQSGNEVLRDLNRCNVVNAADATPEALATYASTRHVNNIILLSVRPLDVAIDIREYNAAQNGFIVDKTISRPDGTDAQSTVDTLTGMVGNEITNILQTIHKN